ncbi:hypothetical protein [Paraburkholderia graminis]|uniref:hypothetical protein n=1 Tax=Paraburkholderia graminis TaxID=60548 RepID=UPI00286CE99A|nr:hypothetical protein [Paraburkholderia graminis]
MRELSVAGPIRELPLCYWRVRVSRIPPDRLVPAERARLARVQETLDRLESMQRDQNAA